MTRTRNELLKGRGAQTPVGNRYQPLELDFDPEHLTDEDILADAQRSIPTRFFEDNSQSIVSENRSPDIPFRYSVNPYRGCEHGCAYCYARPTHEYFGLDPAMDFESVILVKPRAAELFRDWLSRPQYAPETVMFSGVTDCYQPVEKRLRLTRACLQVAARCRQPIGIITKNALVTRDLEFLQELARHRAVMVGLSIPTLRPDLSRKMEPRTSSPAARLRAIRELSSAGVPTQVMVAPIIPGLTDAETPAILQAAREAGASLAGYTLLRLPPGTRQVFMNWLGAAEPNSASRVQSMVQATRQGSLSSSEFGVRMRGVGAYAELISQTFSKFARKLGYQPGPCPLETSSFIPPSVEDGQLRLF